MHSYIRTLLTIILAASSAAIATPSQAQNIKELNLETSNSNVLPVSSQSDTVTDKSISVQSQLDVDGNSSVSQSDSSANPGGANTKSAITNPNPRIPISSRVFAAPSMQQ